MTEKHESCHILAADIGGTNCRFAHFTATEQNKSNSLTLVRTFRVRTAAASSFAHLLSMVRDNWGSLSQFKRAALALAGPVLHTRTVRLTNVPWALVELDTVPDLPVQTRMLNDFEAQAWACLYPECQNLLPIVPRSKEAEERALCGTGQTLAVIGAGTGVGMSALLSGTPPRTIASEGGHALFPFNPTETQFEVFAHTLTGRATIEHILSGRGLSLLHSFHTGEELPPAQVAAIMTSTPVCEWYARFFGRVCREWTLATMAMNGLYITGGIATSNPILLHHPEFLQSFYNSPEHSDLLRTVPLYLVRNTDAALWGAAIFSKYAS